MVLREIFTGMPRVAAAFLLVQHMPAFINERLRNSLDAVTDLDVVMAETGMPLAPGQLVIAPSGQHMKVRNNKSLELVSGEPVCHVCPAADVLMSSFKADPSLRLTGVVLTGMGRDGSDGISHIKRIGGRTFAQNEETAAVYGMPRRAIETGDVDFVGTPEEIAAKIGKTASGGRRSARASGRRLTSA